MMRVNVLIGLVGLVALACSSVHADKYRVSSVKSQMDKESAMLLEMSANWMKKVDAEQGIDKAQFILVAHLIESIEYNRRMILQELAYDHPDSYIWGSTLSEHYRRASVSIDSQLSGLVKINEKLAREDLADDIVKIGKLSHSTE